MSRPPGRGVAAGEYVSVSSQADVERADVERERAELTARPEAELAELKGIWMARGLDAELAGRVAAQLTQADALGAHAGGAPRLRAAGRVLLWGVIAMAATGAIGRLVGMSV
ncbi:VIT1/CCC1 transporter family protein [Roseicyclus sp.]|uniref:VIT1/CCC1 transporter family protein n=1 Tax=Roseicyclus sp. TaxID=1914329 RepID=UPI003FA0AD4C